MRYATLRTGVVLGLSFQPIKVEVSISKGLPSFSIAGLTNSAACDARVRIRSALNSQGFTFPNRRVVVNVAPSDIKKDVPIFDLPIALGIILAMQSDHVKPVQTSSFMGELSLDGAVCSSPISTTWSLAARNYGLDQIYINAVDAPLCAHISGIQIYGVRDIRHLIGILFSPNPVEPVTPMPLNMIRDDAVDFAQVEGLLRHKRVMMICAAGRHNLLMLGAPGSGKSMLANRLHTILPDLTVDQHFEREAICPTMHKTPEVEINLSPPLRAPHHTVTTTGLVGGGSVPVPGEISLAHRGVLFLDELLEFRKAQLEALRVPLEEGRILLSRAGRQAVYPSDFLLVAAYNPCPCGYLSDSRRECTCTTQAIETYQNRLSGPLMERFDLQLTFQSDDDNVNQLPGSVSSSVEMRSMVSKALEFGRDPDVRKRRALTPDAVSVLEELSTTEHYSFRQRVRLMSVAKTISNFEASIVIKPEHILEALSYLPRRRGLVKRPL